MGVAFLNVSDFLLFCLAALENLESVSSSGAPMHPGSTVRTNAYWDYPETLDTLLPPNSLSKGSATQIRDIAALFDRSLRFAPGTRESFKMAMRKFRLFWKTTQHEFPDVKDPLPLTDTIANGFLHWMVAKRRLLPRTATMTLRVLNCYLAWRFGMEKYDTRRVSSSFSSSYGKVFVPVGYMHAAAFLPHELDALESGLDWADPKQLQMGTLLVMNRVTGVRHTSAQSLTWRAVDLKFTCDQRATYHVTVCGEYTFQKMKGKHSEHAHKRTLHDCQDLEADPNFAVVLYAAREGVLEAIPPGSGALTTQEIVEKLLSHQEAQGTNGSVKIAEKYLDCTVFHAPNDRAKRLTLDSVCLDFTLTLTYESAEFTIMWNC